MAATVTIRRHTGSGPTKTNITGTTNRAGTADDPAPGTSNPIPIPSAGTKYSYWVVTRLSADVTPAGTINNVRWYMDGANGFGTGVSMKAQNATGYVQASGTPGDTGLQLTVGNYATLSGAPVDAFTFTSGSPKSLSGSITNPSTGDFADYMVYQLEVISTASPGVIPAETATWKYDET